jgi:hypothetical protein
MNDMTAICDWAVHASLGSALGKLDALLRRMSHAAAQAGREPGADPFRGLYLSEADILHDLQGPRALAPPQEPAAPLAAGARFAALRDRFGLSQLELDTLLIALAPDIDPRYERIFGYLQDDVTRRRPGVDLLLSLLCHSAPEKLCRLALFASSGPLRANRLLFLSGDDTVPLARREIYLDPPIIAFLLGDARLDARLARFAHADDNHAPGAIDPRLARIADRAAARGRHARLYLQGGDEAEKHGAASALAAARGASLLVADIGRAARLGDAFEPWLHALARDALLRRAIVYFGRIEALSEAPARETFFAALAAFKCMVILSGIGEMPVAEPPVRGMVSVPFAPPSWRDRRAAWRDALHVRGISAEPGTLDALAERFRFTRGQIEDAAETAASVADDASGDRGAAHLFAAARSRSGHELASLTRRIAPAHGWDDIVLPDDALGQLHDICRRVTRRHLVLGTWGFGAKLSSGLGVNALFHGHSGTGKTMAAEVVARALQLDLYKIDLAGVVSKYIGETEKNLDRIFAAAEDANAILLFDEADALFGKRSEVRDSHDRYANLEVSYLLQKMEQHEGVSILATNLRQNLDDAFLRRLAFTVPFPFPDEVGRRRIWAGIWPRELPLADDVDADWLAARFMLSGGNIRNAALAAAFLAVDDGGPVRLSHVLRAVRGEFLKMGKTLTPVELASPLAATLATAA